ncbi:MAG TPA: glutamate 5-kinase [Clostridia bacterium]|nr:glutamate 5-kinase [Clostridia bacterium]
MTKVGTRNLGSVDRLLVKIGTSSLTYETGKLNISQLEKLVRELADLHNQGKEVILVSSGAVGAGLGRLGWDAKPRTIPEKQAAAAVGQGALLHMYEKLFAEYGVTVGQILLTREDFSDRRRFLNARNCLEVLMRYGVIPVINENDTVSIDELRFGDNDMLAALVAGCTDADLVIILSDIDGFYAGNPRENPDARLIDFIEEITPDIEELAGGAGSKSATGGMISKLNAAKVTMHSGIPMVLARATEGGVISRIVNGDPLGTIFLPEGKLVNKKRWIAYGSTVQGKVFVDAGAARAILRHGKSLLPSGVTGVEGVFEMGNTVSIIGPGGGEIARGVASYSCEDIAKIKGLQTDEIEKVLGRKDYDEIIHRNNLVLDY